MRQYTKLLSTTLCLILVLPCGAACSTGGHVPGGGGNGNHDDDVIVIAGKEFDRHLLLERSLVSMGDPGPLGRAMKKAMAGETVVIGSMGGSITAGSAASSFKYAWPSLVFDWFTKTFPQGRFQFVNAAIGATGSRFAAFRAERDLLVYQPDIVLIEFAVNDHTYDVPIPTMEGLIRQIRKRPNSPAAIMLFMMNSNGDNVQQMHAQVGYHYDLPMISYKDALWPQIRGGRLAWSDISPDTIHPNDQGHALAAEFVIAYLEQVRAMLDDIPTGVVETLPAPLVSDLYEFVSIYDPINTQPEALGQWNANIMAKPSESFWQSSKANDCLEIMVEGTELFLSYRHGDPPLCNALVYVDERPPVKLVGHGDLGWGWHMKTDQLATGLTPGQHRVRICIDPVGLDNYPWGFHVFMIATAGAQ